MRLKHRIAHLFGYHQVRLVDHELDIRRDGTGSWLAPDDRKIWMHVPDVDIVPWSFDVVVRRSLWRTFLSWGEWT